MGFQVTGPRSELSGVRAGHHPGSALDCGLVGSRVDGTYARKEPMESAGAIAALLVWIVLLVRLNPKLT